MYSVQDKHDEARSLIQWYSSIPTYVGACLWLPLNTWSLSLVLRRLDYGNATLSGLPEYQFHRLHFVINMAELHWLSTVDQNHINFQSLSYLDSAEDAELHTNLERRICESDFKSNGSRFGFLRIGFTIATLPPSGKLASWKERLVSSAMTGARTSLHCLTSQVGIDPTHKVYSEPSGSYWQLPPKCRARS